MWHTSQGSDSKFGYRDLSSRERYGDYNCAYHENQNSVCVAKALFEASFIKAGYDKIHNKRGDYKRIGANSSVFYNAQNDIIIAAFILLKSAVAVLVIGLETALIILSVLIPLSRAVVLTVLVIRGLVVLSVLIGIIIGRCILVVI